MNTTELTTEEIEAILANNQYEGESQWEYDTRECIREALKQLVAKQAANRVPSQTLARIHELRNTISQTQHAILDMQGEKDLSAVVPNGNHSQKAHTQPLATITAINAIAALAEEVTGCFDAAITEGLHEALAQTSDTRLKDLVERRLMHAYYAANVIPALPVDINEQPAPSNQPQLGGIQAVALFERRWALASDGFGLQRDDNNGNYIHIDDAIETLHKSLIADEIKDVADTESDAIHALARCRDAFDVPERGGYAENEWRSAMADPMEVPAYVEKMAEKAQSLEKITVMAPTAMANAHDKVTL